MCRLMRLTLILGLGLLLAVTAGAIDRPRTLRVGSFDYYPAIFLDDDGAVKGFYVDLLAEIAAREGLAIEYLHGSWNQGLQRIKDGEVDLLTSVAYTKERAAFMDFGRIPLLTVWGELYVPAGVELHSIKEVDGKKIAVMKGDFNARHFIDLIGKFGMACEFIEFADFSQVFLAVQHGRVDAGIANAVYGSARHLDYRLHPTGIIFNPFDIYFVVPKGRHADVLALLDRYLAEWRDDERSSYYQARLKWGGSKPPPTEIIPSWVYHSTGVATLLFVAGLIFILLLRRQVRQATGAIVQQQEVLRDSHDAYQSILRTAHDGFWLLDRQGTIIDVNETYARQSGYSRTDIIGMPIWQLENQKNEEEVRLHLERIVSEGSDLFESMHRRKDGSQWHVEASCKYSPAREGRMYLFLRDISERKQAQAELLRKNIEIERLIYAVSHDLRSPLITIQTFLEFLRQDQQTGDPERVATDMGHIKAAASTMERLLEELLQMSRIGRVVKVLEQVKLHEIIDEARLAVVGRLAERQIELRLAGENPLLYGDRPRLAQLWQNLLDNAAKYMGEQNAPRIETGTILHGSERVYFVRDNGMGIAAEHADRIFNPFEKIDQHSPGSGLGLAMVKRIVELYQGRIWLESNGPGQGSTFFFTLPQAEKGRCG